MHRCTSSDATAPLSVASLPPPHISQKAPASPHLTNTSYADLNELLLSSNTIKMSRARISAWPKAVEWLWGRSCISFRAMSPHLWAGVTSHWLLDWVLSTLYLTCMSSELRHTWPRAWWKYVLACWKGKCSIGISNSTKLSPLPLHPQLQSITYSSQQILPSFKMLPGIILDSSATFK